MYSELKNLAGNPVSIFLCRFDLKGSNGIDFVLNEEIHKDMYPDLESKLRPLVRAIGETLLRYRHLCKGNTIMDLNILTTGEAEVMLSPGMGKYFDPKEKDNLFEDTKLINNILGEVMSRRTLEEKQGKPTPKMERNSPERIDFEPLEQLGNLKAMEYQLQDPFYQPRAGLKQMRQDDLPKGVTPKRGYDHRGHCLEFHHERYGYLGKIVLIGLSGEETLIQADLNVAQGSPFPKKRKEMFEKVVAVANQCLQITKK